MGAKGGGWTRSTGHMVSAHNLRTDQPMVMDVSGLVAGEDGLIVLAVPTGEGRVHVALDPDGARALAQALGLRIRAHGWLDGERLPTGLTGTR